MNPANPYIQKNLPKDNRVLMTVISDPRDPDLPIQLRRKLNGDITKSLNAKKPHSYEQDDIISILSSVNEKQQTQNRCFLLKDKDTHTGGIIPTNHTDSAGRRREEYDIFGGFRRCDVDDILPRDGPQSGVRIVDEPIQERELLAFEVKVQTNPVQENNVYKGEAFASTTASVFVSPGNQTQLQNLFEPVALYGKVSNLAKLLQPYETHPIANDLRNKYTEVIDGENTLGYFTVSIADHTYKIPYLIQRCVYIKDNAIGGKDFFFQFMKTSLGSLTENFWFTFNVSVKLSQSESSRKCCVAFCAFLEYHGIAPVHGMECTMHTRYHRPPTNDWNTNIGYFRVAQSGFCFASDDQLNAIGRDYNYRLLNGVYPFFKSDDEIPKLEESNIDVQFTRKLNKLAGKFIKLPTKEDKIELMEKLNDLLFDLSDVEESEMSEVANDIGLL